VHQIRLEVQIQYQLNHPNILKIYDHYEDDTNIYLVLQFCARGQLYQLLRKEGKIKEAETCQYIREVICAIQCLHSQENNVIHRDIKPENILIADDGSVKLADFGWSNYYLNNENRFSYCGTPEYLAPEMIQKRGHGPSIDLWNLGILTFELLNGKSPFAGSN
jgi:serine/threonine protein kinase